MESKRKVCTISVEPPPIHLYEAHSTLFTQEATEFLSDLIYTFEDKVTKLHRNRLRIKSYYNLSKKLPTFLDAPLKRDKSWKVSPVPFRLRNRRLDLGDVSPANTRHFFDSLRADVQGIQVDFDDGHCPTWENQILGLFNVYQAVRGRLHKALNIESVPILMLRPRAWNMIEHNIIVNGKKAPGPLVDFGLLMFHNSKILMESEAGPFFYLSKLEGAFEAKLWNQVFVWTQKRLKMPLGTIKACVLIENILATFEMDEILYELKDHSIGLNCGIWDYAASIINKFGDRAEFILPDRNKYVNMQRHFLKKYMELVVQTCHARGTYATGGMAAMLMSNDKTKSWTLNQVIQAKRLEIVCGIDGFMVYDSKLIPHVNKLWNDQRGNSLDPINLQTTSAITESDLLLMPSGGVTYDGIKHNIAVAILFIYNWLQGRGHFYYRDAVEDSATAEISRSQIWQWIRHEAVVEDLQNNVLVTESLIRRLTSDYLRSEKFDVELHIASNLFLEIILSPLFHDFITTYLNDHYLFRENDKQLRRSKCVHKL